MNNNISTENNTIPNTKNIQEILYTDNRFHEHLQRVQGKQSNKIPQNVLESIRQKLSKN